eukprot:gnl/Hemi2/11375_TR3935_c0_g1_i1.p1 gnl/Hemi2/11375_TR3935_c0_g1~~gnl/Hemi2/11375_TR3935_c0_g1_i1.p1  ORF type:complete len:264 (-),score=54.70 gnl/Hemi2/11375_TR3935_c0_g1_i1:291-1082(-)
MSSCLWRPDLVLNVPVNHSASLVQNNLSFLPSANLLVFASSSRAICFDQRDARPGEVGAAQVVESRDGSLVMQAKWVSSGNTDVLVMGTTASIQVWKVEKPNSRCLLIVPLDGGGHARGIAGFKAQNLIAVGLSNGEIILLSANGENVRFEGSKLPARAGSITAMCAGEAGPGEPPYLVTGHIDGNISVYKYAAGSFEFVFHMQAVGFPCMTVAVCGGNILLAGFASGDFRIIDLKTQKPLARVCGHSRTINAVVVHPTLPFL